MHKSSCFPPVPQSPTAQHSWQTPQSSSGFWPCFEILSVFWELLLGLSRHSWEPFEEHQGACCCCCCWERGCDHPETLPAGRSQKPAHPQGEEGQGGRVPSETCSLMTFSLSCTEEGSAASVLVTSKQGDSHSGSLQPGASWLESSFALQGLWVLAGIKLPMSQKSVLEGKKGTNLLGYIRQCVASSLRKGILPLHSGETHLERCAQSWYKRCEHTGVSGVKGHERH